MCTIYVYVTTELTDNLFRTWSDFSDAERKIFHALLFQVKDKVREELEASRDVQPGPFAASFAAARMECVITVQPEESEVTILVVRVNFSDDDFDPDGGDEPQIDDGRHKLDHAVIRIADRRAVLRMLPQDSGGGRKSQLSSRAGSANDQRFSTAPSSGSDKNIDSIFAGDNMTGISVNSCAAPALNAENEEDDTCEIIQCDATSAALFETVSEAMLFLSELKTTVILPRLIDRQLFKTNRSEKMKTYALERPPVRPDAVAGMLRRDLRFTVFPVEDLTILRDPRACALLGMSGNCIPNGMALTEIKREKPESDRLNGWPEMLLTPGHMATPPRQDFA